MNKKCKIKVAVSAIAFATVISLGGCHSNTVSHSHVGTPYTVENFSQVEYNCMLSSDFSGEHLFVRLCDPATLGGNSEDYVMYLGSVDNTGSLEYALLLPPISRGSYEYHGKDGMLQIFDSNSGTWTSLNENGKRIYQYTANSEPNSENTIVSEILACDDNYVCVAEVKAGFDAASGLTYKIIDYKGDTIYTFESETVLAVEALGDSVFVLYKLYDNSNEIYFHADSQSVIDSPYDPNYPSGKYGNGNIVCDLKIGLTDGTIIDLSTIYNSVDIAQDEVQICYVNDSSGISSRSQAYSSHHLDIDCVNNHYLIYATGNSFTNEWSHYIYNWETGETIDCLSDIAGLEVEFLMENGTIVCLAKGSDLNLYYKIIDCNGNIIKELTQISDSYGVGLPQLETFKQNILVVPYNQKCYVYNLSTGKERVDDYSDGKEQVYVTGDFCDGWAQCKVYGLETYGQYSLVVSRENYVNKKGKLLFETNEDKKYLDDATNTANILFMPDSKVISY